MFFKPSKIFYLIVCVTFSILTNVEAQQQWNPGHSVGTTSGIYSYAYNQTPNALVEIYPAAIPNTGLTYQWYSSQTPTGVFSAISGATSSSYTPPALTSASVTTYYKRSSTVSPLGTIYSNILKISVVSVNWEDLNYIREHDVKTIAQTSWTAIDQLAIGSKLQTTTYLDGLGRSIEKISRQSATPPTGSNTWGDMIQFSVYDALGREPIKYLPYTTTTQSGKFKTTQLTEQPAYYANPSTYNESAAYSTTAFDLSPLNRIVNVKEPGTAWNASSGNTAAYDVNSAPENVQMWGVDYTQGDAPINQGAYLANTLHKLTSTDVNGKSVIEYINEAGQLILKKVQIDAAPTVAHAGWICTYNVYDDFGLVRFQIQPEGVKYLDANSWSFAGTNGALILSEQVFQYSFDDKGRTIWKKAPGASPLNMLYDIRDRVVFMQDGNQAHLSTPQWTANLYDGLDRTVITTLYNTTESITSLNSDISSAAATNTVTITNTGTATVTAALSYCPISTANLTNTAVSTILKYSFYDNYSFGVVKSFNTTYTNLNAYSTSDPNVIPIANSARVLSMPSGSMTRVLNTSVFLSATNYYDEKGRSIQRLEDNIKTGTDITTSQYHFDGRLLSTCNNHTSTGTGFSAFTTLTKYIFDILGRVTSIQKQFGTNTLKTLSAYDYDDMGRVKVKHIDPNYNNPNSGLPDLESLNYTFNIHNQITGINKDYALKTSGSYSKWGHYFGFYLGYDNKDNVFTAAQLNGQVSGQAWNTQGDDAQRRYNYTYDNAGRLINATYTEQQHPGDGWSNGSMDFSVSGTSGQITYDYNGNLLTMLQKGVMPGTTTPITVDDLRYVYNSYSNKLLTVTDQMPSPTLNGQFGDFKDGANGATPDYVYDYNGNLVIDLNKNAQSLNNGAPGTNGIHYNFLDKPDQIRIVGKGTIEIVYSADGEKLQRAFIPDAGGSGTVTTYINQFVFQETATLTTSSPAPFAGSGVALAYINFEEGRVRVMKAISTGNGYDALTEAGNLTLPLSPSGGGGTGAFDYFIMDYQQNVRMILTEETHSATNTCTMETSRASAEDPVFEAAPGDEVENTRYTKPTGWTNNSTASVSQVGRLCGHYIGPNTLQKVMAGDQITASVQYYLQTGETGTNPNILGPLLASLSQAIGGPSTAGTLVHGSGSAITTNLNGVPGFVTAVEPNSNTIGTAQAYLTILFFDERFNLIAASDGGVQWAQVASSWSTSTPALALSNVKAPKNGYAFIYVSNRSDQDVYFDNLIINLSAGNIIEENHYYAFGLKMAAISSKKLGDVNEGQLKNLYQYQGDFNEFDDDLGWNEFDLRNYDPQVGRFVQADPFQQYPSAYTGMGNDPVNLIDPSGGIGIPCPGTSALTIFFMKAGEGIENGLSAIGNISSLLSMGVNITQVGTEIYNNSVQFKIINTQLIGNMTMQAGSAGTGGDGGDDNWKDFYKTDLKRYYKEEYGTDGSENDLGTAFEDIFYNYMISEHTNGEIMHNFRRNNTLWDDAHDRNTVPDFSADAIYAKTILGIPYGPIYPVIGGSEYELKQSKNRGIYLSSNNYQIKGHLDNMAARFRNEIANGFRPDFTLITTADVFFSLTIGKYAASRNIDYYHRSAQYRLVNGVWKFRFIGIFRRIMNY